MLVAVASLTFTFIAAKSVYRLVKAKRLVQAELMDDSFATHTLPCDEGHVPTQAELADAAIDNVENAWSDYWFTPAE